MIVEHDECPQLLQDKYWDECIPKEIPYTVGAEKYKKDEFIGSAEKTLKIEDCDKVRINQGCILIFNHNKHALGVWGYL